MSNGIVGSMARAASNFKTASCVLDQSRIVRKYQGAGQKYLNEMVEEYERIELEMWELRAYTPRWLIGWEQRAKGTTRSGRS